MGAIFIGLTWVAEASCGPLECFGSLYKPYHIIDDNKPMRAIYHLCAGFLAIGIVIK